MAFGIRNSADLGRLSAEFGADLVCARAPSTAVALGTEHEYRVVDASNGAQVDFRALIHGFGLGRPRLDPDDPYAYRLSSGSVITCDQEEAEIVLPPIEAETGTFRLLAASLEVERAALAARLGPDRRLDGHSTHVSVSVPTAVGEPTGSVFARTFAADLVRLVASSDGCGVWIRPRPERLELCIDYVQGERLVAVMTFAAAAVAACTAHLADPTRRRLPPRLRVTARPPRHRSGWHLGRGAFEGDVLGSAERDRLRLASGGRMPAVDHLRAAWRGIRTLAEQMASNEELAAVDAIVGMDRVVARRYAPAERGALASPFGDALTPRSRDRFEVAPVAVTWHFAVFLVLARRRWMPRRAFASVPRSDLQAFLNLLDAGALDAVLTAYLARRPADRLLERHDQAALPGLFDSLGLRRALLPTEPLVRSMAFDTMRGRPS